MSVFEYAGSSRADVARGIGAPFARPTSNDVYGRYSVLVPTLFTSTFRLPGFKGQVKAYQGQQHHDGRGLAEPLLRWSAGDKLRDLVANGEGTAAGRDGMEACGKSRPRRPQGRAG